MIKLQYLLRRPRHVPLVAFHARVLEELAPRLLAADPAGLKVSLATPGVRSPWHLPVHVDLVALVSVWTREPAAVATFTSLATACGLPCGAYRVDESTPRAYHRDWPDGTPSPGLAMLTLFRQRPGMSRAEFVRTWHEGHSPMALRIHPLWNYLRNVVVERLAPDTPPWDGIVEEHFRDPRDVYDPRRFYGGTLRMLPNLLHVVTQVRNFLHLPTLRNHLLVEHWLRTPE